MYPRTLCTLGLILLLSACLAHPRQAGAADPLKAEVRLVTSNHQLSGESVEELIDEAALRAVSDATGRIYVTEYMIRARDLLEKYLARNARDFMARYYINENQLRGGERFLDIDVVIDTQKLYDDLVEKNFIYLPEFRPVFTLWLNENFNNSPAPAPVGRKRLLEILNEQQLRYLWTPETDDPNIPLEQRREQPIQAIPADRDISESPELFQKALAEAERYKVEAFITGSIESTETRTEQVYFEDYHFVETRIRLLLVRADTGEILERAETTTSAGNTDVTEAVRVATLSGIEKTVPRLLEGFSEDWKKTIHRGAKTRLLIVNADEDRRELLHQILLGVGPDAAVYTRGAFADTVTFNVDWDGSSEELRNLLLLTDHPAMTIVNLGPRTLLLLLED